MKCIITLFFKYIQITNMVLKATKIGNVLLCNSTTIILCWLQKGNMFFFNFISWFGFSSKIQSNAKKMFCKKENKTLKLITAQETWTFKFFIACTNKINYYSYCHINHYVDIYVHTYTSYFSTNHAPEKSYWIMSIEYCKIYCYDF